MNTIRALSLWQPWGTLFAHGLKRLETRSWRYRGAMPTVLAVHAAKRWTPEQIALRVTEPFRTALAGHGPLPLGCVLGLVRLIACTRTEAMSDLTDQERAFGNYSPNRFAWECDRFHPFTTPIPLVGRQGLFFWKAPADVIALAQEMMSDILQPAEG